jgi:hypothetical protein
MMIFYLIIIIIILLSIYIVEKIVLYYIKINFLIFWYDLITLIILTLRIAYCYFIKNKIIEILKIIYLFIFSFHNRICHILE